MNYYPFHIGDYASATRHLSWDEDVAFRRLLDWYYTNEKPLPSELSRVERLILARSNAQRDAVALVLEEFFVLTDAGWINQRADAEIEAMLAKQEHSASRDAHEQERMKRYRERRAFMFEALRVVQIVPAYDVSMKELQRLFDTHCNAPATHLQREQVVSLNEIATAIPTPTPTPTPILKERESAEPPAETRERTPRASRLASDWQPSNELLSWAKAERLDLDTSKSIASFVDYWHAKSGKDGTKLDWDGTFRNWIRRERAPPKASVHQRTFREQDYDQAAARIAEFAPRVASKTIATQQTTIKGESYVRAIN